MSHSCHVMYLDMPVPANRVDYRAGRTLSAGRHRVQGKVNGSRSVKSPDRQ